MKKILNISAFLLIIVTLIIGIISIQSIGVFVLIIGGLIVVILLSISEILENQEILFKEIREQNTLIIKIGQEVKTVKVKENKIAENNEN